MAASINFKTLCGCNIIAYLIVTNLTIFLFTIIVGLVTPGDYDPAISMPWLCLPLSFTGFLHSPWTLLTYMFTQYSFLHLLFNMLWLLWFGKILIIADSPRHLLMAYITGGLGGGFLYLLVGTLFISIPAETTYLCGASASVICIMAYSACRMPNLKLNLFIFGEVKLKWVAALCVILMLAGSGQTITGSVVAHGGGLLAGLALTLFNHEKISGKKIYKRWRKKPAFFTTVGSTTDNERLDILLDKINVSGFSSLTHRERIELTTLSRGSGKFRKDSF